MENFNIELHYTEDHQLAQELDISKERHEEMGLVLVELTEKARLMGKTVGWILQHFMEECESANEVLWFAHSSFSFFNNMVTLNSKFLNDDEDVQDS